MNTPANIENMELDPDVAQMLDSFTQATYAYSPEEDSFANPMAHIYLQGLSDQLYEHALSLKSQFEIAFKLARRQNGGKLKGSLYIKIRRRSDSLAVSCDWGDHKYLGKHITQGPNFKFVYIKKTGLIYDRRQIITKNREPYEADLFDRFEPKFREIRKASAALTKLSQQVRLFDRALKVCLEIE